MIKIVKNRGIQSILILNYSWYSYQFRYCSVNNSGLFVEKIAFEQPYQATKVHNMDELLNILSLRPEYFGEEGEAGPFVYNNGEYVGTLTNKNN